jgi:hypothetical protein
MKMKVYKLMKIKSEKCKHPKEESGAKGKEMGKK